jgi:hypothetical protein
MSREDCKLEKALSTVINIVLLPNKCKPVSKFFTFKIILELRKRCSKTSSWQPYLLARLDS